MISKLRPWKMGDLENLVLYGDNLKISKNMSDAFPSPYTHEKAKAFIEMAMSGNPIRIFAIDIDGKASGGIGIHPQSDIHRKNAELGYWLGEPFWGKGIMTKSIQEIVKIGFRDFDIDRIFARPFSTNLASQKVLQNSGFKLEGRFEKTIIKNGEYLDELIYAIRK